MVGAEERLAYSAAVCARLLEREDVRDAMSAKRAFAVYLATAQEIDLTVLVRRLWSEGCPVLAPAWDGEVYRLLEYAPGTKLVAGPMGVLEPEPTGEATSVPEPAVWIVPGLAFTKSGERLGYGGGWYDRMLGGAGGDAIVLGVAYPFQIVESIPSEPHDIRLTGVVSAEMG